MSGKKGMKHYTVEEKLEAVRMFYEEGRTHAEITARLGIRSEGRVETWVRQYRREGEMGLCKPIGRRKKVQDEKSRVARLEMENALLKKFHTELRKEVLAKRNIGLSIITEQNTK